jgi:hypothetical protein
MADDDRNSAYRTSPTTHWSQSPRIYSHSHHGTPAQEYSGFNFPSPHMPMEPSAFSSSMQQRPMHQHLQPLVMPQWPSMLGSSQTHSNYQPVYPQPIQPIQSMSVGSLQTPVSATSTRSASTPRKTLTDMDRKRMCQYAEEHPNSKQTEIGGMSHPLHCSWFVLTSRQQFLAWNEGMEPLHSQISDPLIILEARCPKSCDRRKSTSFRMTAAARRPSAQKVALPTSSAPLRSGQRTKYTVDRSCNAI